MENRKEYFIRINDVLMEVTEEQYKDYYKDKARQKYLAKQAKIHNEQSYNALDTDELLGESIIVDETVNIEEEVITKMMIEKLRSVLEYLTGEEYKLIFDIYFQGISERELEKITGIPRKTISYRKEKIFKKIKKLLEI